MNVRFSKSVKSLPRGKGDFRKEVSGNDLCQRTQSKRASPKRIFTRRAMRGRDDGEIVADPPSSTYRHFRNKFRSEKTRRCGGGGGGGVGGAPRTLVNPPRHVPRTHVGIANFLAAVTHCAAHRALPPPPPPLPSLLSASIRHVCVLFS